MEGNNNEAEKDAKLSCCTRFKTSMHNAGHFIYNSDTGEVLGRGGLSWLKILCFYLVFYCVLVGFWATCMVGFIRTLDPVAPTMQKMFSMMKDNPGMNFEPFNDTSTTLITFNSSNTSYITYVSQLSTVLSAYNESISATQKLCSDNNGATLDTPCYFDLSLLGDNCTQDNSFGYEIGKPCVLLKINRVFLWQPNNLTFDRLQCSTDPEQKSSDCAKFVEFSKVRPAVKSDIVPGYISVSCEGENDGDRDNINKVTFYPPGGFPAYFYPYYNQDGYKSPLVMAQFDVKQGRVSLILCKVWTRDIIHDQIDLQGSIHFELFVGL